MHPIIYTFLLLLDIFSWLVIAYVIVSIIMSLEIFADYKPKLYRIGTGLYKIIGVPLEYVTRFVPRIGAIDLAPLLLLVIISVIKYTIQYYFVLT